MQALNEITKILTALGAKPEIIVNNTGETLIKVNAPKANETSEKTENE